MNNTEINFIFKKEPEWGSISNDRESSYVGKRRGVNEVRRRAKAQNDTSGKTEKFSRPESYFGEID